MGFDLKYNSAYLYSLQLLPEFEVLDLKDPNCVVLGDAAEHFTYGNINQAFRVLLGIREKGQPPRMFTLGRGYTSSYEFLIDTIAKTYKYISLK